MSNSRNNELAQSIIAAMIMGNDDMQYSRALAASMHEQSAYKNVLSSDGENQLTDRDFVAADEVQGTCPIMHIPFEIGDKVTELPCGHIFDPDGIRKWLKDEKAECPVCRFKLQSKEIKNESGTASESENDEIIDGRSNIINNLRRISTLPMPHMYHRHPFGPSSERMSNIIHEEDSANDVMRAIVNTLGQPSPVPPQFGTLVSAISENYRIQRNYTIANPFDNIIVNDIQFFDARNGSENNIDSDDDFNFPDSSGNLDTHSLD